MQSRTCAALFNRCSRTAHIAVAAAHEFAAHFMLQIVMAILIACLGLIVMQVRGGQGLAAAPRVTIQPCYEHLEWVPVAVDADQYIFRAQCI